MIAIFAGCVAGGISALALASISPTPVIHADEGGRVTSIQLDWEVRLLESLTNQRSYLDRLRRQQSH